MEAKVKMVHKETADHLYGVRVVKDFLTRPTKLPTKKNTHDYIIIDNFILTKVTRHKVKGKHQTEGKSLQVI